MSFQIHPYRHPLEDKIFAIDFDGTCVTHEYPNVGREIGAAPVLKEMVEAGAKLILWTMRSGECLRDAIDWFEKHAIPLFGINTNPEQHTWTASPKAYAHTYIDDAAFGVPLITSKDERPYVDWGLVREELLPTSLVDETMGGRCPEDVWEEEVQS
jgi:hypothetical protein